MTASEPGPVEREERLAVLRKRMAKAARRRDAGRYEELKAEHDRLKAVHVEQSHAEQREAARMRRAAERAREERERPRPWRLPPGFASPLAAERARSGWRPREEPVAPAGGLRPWRRGGSLMETRIWRP